MIDMFFGGGQGRAGSDMYNIMNQGLQSSEGMFNRGLGYLNPFMSREQGLYQQYLNAINQAQDPTKLYNQFAGSYKESPEALAQTQMAQKAASNAAAAGGMLGSGAASTQAAKLATDIRAGDFDKYMENQFALRNQYLGGISGLQGQGFQASMAGANLSAQEAQAQQRYYEDMAEARGRQDIGTAGGWSDLFGTGLGIASDIWGGGSLGGLAKNIWNAF
jgi:hypothetical protein